MKGKEKRKGKERKISYLPTVSNFPLSLAVSVENIELGPEVCSENEPVVLALIDLLVFPLL